MPLHLRNVHRTDGGGLSHLLRVAAAAEAPLRERLRRRLLHGGGRVRPLPAHVHAVRVAHELHGVRTRPPAAVRRVPDDLRRRVSCGVMFFFCFFVCVMDVFRACV